MKHLLIFLITIASLHASEPKKDIITLDATSEHNLNIETAVTEESDFATHIEALGSLEAIPENRSVLSSRIPGRIIESDIAIGDYVEKDMPLVLLESRQPGNPPPSVWLNAPANGTILSINAVLGSPVEPTDILCEIAELKKMFAIATMTQQQAATIQQGTTAEITIPLKPDQKLQGKLLRFTTCPCPDPACALGQNLSKRTDEDHEGGNSAGVVFTVNNPDNQLRPGMKLRFLIRTSERKNVISIPRSALQGDGLSKFVFIRDYDLKHAFLRVPVKVGEINYERAEILSGLFPGDEVVTTGSYQLSFAGKGTASLKEALDAAHGHPHNEDGSEMSAEEIAASSGENHDHSHPHHNGGPIVIFLSIACAVLFILLIASPFLFRKTSKA